MADTVQAPLPIEDQMIVHQVASHVPLTTEKGLIVPEKGSSATLLNEIAPGRSDLAPALSRVFSQNARPAVPGAVTPQASAPAADGRKFFMIDPYEMSVGSPYNFRVNAQQKWSTAKGLIEQGGGEVVTVRGADAEGGTRETFTRDRYAMIDGHAYLPDAKAYDGLLKQQGKHDDGTVAAYDGEIAQAEKFLKSQGVPTHKVDGAWFEGGNIIADKKSGTLFMGLETDRDNSKSAQLLANAVNQNNAPGQAPYTMIGVPLVQQETYYHLDLGMSDPLPKGKNEILLSPNVTDNDTFNRIKSRLGNDRVIGLGADEPVGSTNFVAPSKDHIVPTVMSDKVKGELTNRGYTVDQNPELQDLTMAAGGVRCMTNEIPNLPKPATP